MRTILNCAHISLDISLKVKAPTFSLDSQFVSTLKAIGIMCPSLIMIKISKICIAQFLSWYTCTQLRIITSLTYCYPRFCRAAYRHSNTLQGINTCRVPINYTKVERDNCGQNALSKGIRTEWNSNPRPSDYESRTRNHYTTVLPCSSLHLHVAHLQIKR